MAITFDTLGYSERLKESGVDAKQADAHAKAVRDYVMPELVTRSDLRATELRLIIAVGGIVATATGILLAALPLVLK
ncbi:hypothetical protein [Phyllobacterium leguminum]|uniref:DUF1640 domain-containing protein n=1 Tax=Phyllobacterium leguminum TaxID=314237 RepID=A0A318T8B4_9HYPH|nr:hypothetical protein [Phyllobacterium leguminum]PYE89551.1 hypothetical protein C7477_10358 [Phyllobacterium leguminum]